MAGCGRSMEHGACCAEGYLCDVCERINRLKVILFVFGLTIIAFVVIIVII